MPLVACSRVVHNASVDTRFISEHPCRFDVFWCNIISLDAELSTRKQNTGEVILQILSSLCLTSHHEVTNTDKKTTTWLP